MRQVVFVVAVAMATLLGGTARAVLPVTDAAAIMQQYTHQLEIIAQWKNQYQQMMNQLNQLKDQYQAITGNRGFGTVFNDPQFRNYLPGDWKQVYDQVQQGGYTGLSGVAQQTWTTNTIYDRCQGYADPTRQSNCQAISVQGSVNEATAMQAFNQAINRIKQIDQLMCAITSTTDPKAIAELQGRIAVEQSNINNEQTKMQLYRMVADAKAQVQEQRQRELEQKAWSSQTEIDAQTVDFSNGLWTNP